MEQKNSFSVADFVIFGLSLLISCAIGLFFAFKGSRALQQTNDDFLLGGRKMPLLPTTISLMSTLVSGILILSYPAEIYILGTAVCWSMVGCCLALVFVGLCIVPVMYRSIRSVNVYEYFEERFQSKTIRRYASLLFTIATLIYMSVVLYAPSIALSGVTPIPTWVLILVVGLLCTIYTSFGGLKAVVWTDLIQGLIMYSGLLAMAIKGTMVAGGSPAEIWNAAERGERTAGLTNLDPNPFQYMTVWTAFIGGTFYWMTSWGANQMTLQRYCSMSSVRKAQLLAFIAIPFMAFISALAFYIGLSMFAYYDSVLGCDPLKAKLIDSKDQLVMYYMIELFHEYPGLPGLFLACLFSGTMSTVSSGVNSLSAVGFEEFGRPLIEFVVGRKCTSREETLTTKGIGFAYGLIAIGLAFAAGPLGGIFRAVNSGLGAISGPLVGLLLLGVFFRWANWIGSLVGVISGTFVALWIFIGAQIHKSPTPWLPLTDLRCHVNQTFTTTGTTVSLIPTSSLLMTTTTQAPDSGDSINPYALSYFMYAVVGMVPTVLVGLAVSLATGGSDIARRRPDMLFSFRCSGNTVRINPESLELAEKVDLEKKREEGKDRRF